MSTAPQTVWLYGIPGGYHDRTCQCADHCLNCFDDLPAIRAIREQMIYELKIPKRDRLHPRARYCSPYCKGRAKRERALDRALAAITKPAG